jgi:hypothetical protein
MSIDQILTELRDERDRLNRAIAALEQGSRNGRGSVASTSTRPRRSMSATARKRISEAMKKRWASGKMKGNRKAR